MLGVGREGPACEGAWKGADPSEGYVTLGVCEGICALSTPGIGSGTAGTGAAEDVDARASDVTGRCGVREGPGGTGPKREGKGGLGDGSAVAAAPWLGWEVVAVVAAVVVFVFAAAEGAGAPAGL